MEQQLTNGHGVLDRSLRLLGTDQLMPGDIVLWDGHVAMYLGNGLMIEPSDGGTQISEMRVRAPQLGKELIGFYRAEG